MFSSSFENLKVVAFKYLHLWLKKGQKFSIKDGAFGTFDFIIEIALDELKINQKMLLKDLCIDFLKGFTS